MRRETLLLAALLLLFPLWGYSDNSSENKDEEPAEVPVSFRISGFVKTDYWYDSRAVVAAREDLFLLFPRNVRPDENGADIWGEPSFNFSAITSRIAGHIEGPDAFGARTSGLIEADFSGVTNADINGFRLRHAFFRLQWTHLELLMGQWWHPMFATAAVPTVISLNTGAPFQPFIRNPQVSLTWTRGNLQTLVAAIAQRDNASDGPMGATPDYLRQSVMPNVHLQLIYKAGNTTTGLAADYKELRPRLVTDANYLTAETLASWSFMAYARHRRGLWDLKGKTILGQNLSEHLLLGGYAESLIEPVTQKVSYTPLNHSLSWASVVYGKNIQTGLFAGYAHNLGAREEITGRYYGRGHDIAYLYRVAPHISFISGKVQLSAEWEYTVAAYGTPDLNGRVRNTSEVANSRILFTGFYFF